MRFGYTIIEMIVVISIMAVIGTISYYGLHSYRKQSDLTNARSEFISNFRAMQNNALSGANIGKPYVLTYNPGSSQYTITVNNLTTAYQLPTKVTMSITDGSGNNVASLCFFNPNALDTTTCGSANSWNSSGVNSVIVSFSNYKERYRVNITGSGITVKNIESLSAEIITCLDNGTACDSEEQCCSGYCNVTCQEIITATPTPIPTSSSTPILTPTPTPIVPPVNIVLGVYQPHPDTSGANIDAYTTQAGKKPAFSWQPTTWQNLDGTEQPFNPQILDVFQSRGIMPGLTWNPSKGSIELYDDRQVAINQTEFSWRELYSGRHDAYITNFARSAAAYNYPFILRFLHEMNGTWYPWGYSVNGNTNPADYVTAWKHIVDIFRREGANNVQFVWNPSVLNSQMIQQYGETLKQTYPGDDYVDWVALDGYSNTQNNWRTLLDEFQPSYNFLTSFSNRPMIFWELGAMEKPTNPMTKADWITEGFLTTIPDLFPKVKVVVWFNSRDGSGRDYRLQSSQNAINAWGQVVNSPLYQGSLP